MPAMRKKRNDFCKIRIIFKIHNVVLIKSLKQKISVQYHQDTELWALFFLYTQQFFGFLSVVKQLKYSLQIL